MPVVNSLPKEGVANFQYDRVTRDVETDKLRVVETIPYTKAPVEDERRGKGQRHDLKKLPRPDLVVGIEV